MLVSYSDSEGSDSEQSQPKQITKHASRPANPTGNVNSASNFALDKSTGRIKVNLHNQPTNSPSGNVVSPSTYEDEPVHKRPRLGPSSSGGAFANFNALLPAPKRDNQASTSLKSTSQNNSNITKEPTRKVFSLRTGAEPAFSRESDTEMREFFAEQNANMNATGNSRDKEVEVIAKTPLPKPAFAKPASPAPAGKAFMFKPLSVTRTVNKKKKTPVSSSTTIAASSRPPANGTTGGFSVHGAVTMPEPAKKEKINLFSAGVDEMATVPQGGEDDEDEIVEDLGPAEIGDSLDAFDSPPHDDPSAAKSQSQSLDDIASDLNLSAAERRQLFGRGGRSGNMSSAINVVNFNTDAEYAANQQLIATGEQVQHNPVRAIASGKHSLRQLVTSAATQKEALEESFATGKRNKKEAGNKYGW